MYLTIPKTPGRPLLPFYLITLYHAGLISIFLGLFGRMTLKVVPPAALLVPIVSYFELVAVFRLLFLRRLCPNAFA